jgi:hypothetical protein
MDAITEIHQAGLKLSLHGDRIKVENSGSLTDRLRNLIRQNKPALISHLSKTHAAKLNELQQNIREAIEERAGILEHDAGLPRQDAEQQAVNSMCVYQYRHREKPNNDLIAILPGCNLQDAEVSLKKRFGSTFLSVNEYSAWRQKEMAKTPK